MNDVGCHHQVVVNEFGAVGVVGMDAAYFSSGEENVVGLFGLKKGFDFGLAAQVEFAASFADELGVAASCKGAD